MVMETSNNTLTAKAENTKTIFACWNDAIKRFFDITGRTTRYEFWAFQTVSLFIFILAYFIGLIFGYYKIIFELYALYFLIPATTISIRRLHDLNMSGKWSIPTVLLAIMILCCWEINSDFTILAVFLMLCYTSYMYWVLSVNSHKTDNIYGPKITEPEIYNQDSKIFIGFMTIFLCVLWVIFLVCILF